MKSTLGQTLILLTVIACFSCAETDRANNYQETIDSLNTTISTLNQKVASYETSAAQLESNKKLAKDFYQKVFGDKNIEAIHDYVGDTYIQHNPNVADGKQALIDAATIWFKGAGKETIEFQRIAAEGDLVFLHIKAVNGTMSVIDIFRVKDNKLVEHWDVMQAVPETSANSHPMF